MCLKSFSSYYFSRAQRSFHALPCQQMHKAHLFGWLLRRTSYSRAFIWSGRCFSGILSSDFGGVRARNQRLFFFFDKILANGKCLNNKFDHLFWYSYGNSMIIYFKSEHIMNLLLIFIPSRNTHGLCQRIPNTESESLWHMSASVQWQC